MIKAKQIFGMAAVAASALVIACGTAFAKPGPVVVTFMERFESHSDAVSSQGNISGETYMYSLLSFYRKLDTGTNGSVYYLHKASVDDGETVSHIYGGDINGDITGKWKYDLGYSHTSNPQRNVVPSNDNDRFSAGVTFKYNPGEKAKKRYDLKTTYSTGTDFSSGTTLSWKLSASDKITKNTTYNVAYQFVWGLSESTNAAGICSVCKEQYANQYYLDLTHKMTKKSRLGLGYLFIDNQYNGARGDDGIVRLSWFRTIR